ncbi:response regulator [filamentous cyanobacterium LEGE 11480]|uniref:Response regulator n=1 Tax=Romeriopsis navalis LEGE 11480 TaxID=2777977 RepID=A0A928VMT3_9CYAN|nr:response regulator [Romeriopsis navalis]MBE9031431.1 response regulator [Romeriopsis navalis LEGE 11480]
MQTLNLVRKRQFSLLLIEDDDVDVMNVQRALRKNHLDIPLQRAAHGLEALEILDDCYGDSSSGERDNLIILLDLNMPKMGGLEFLRILRSRENMCKIPVIILTTSDQPQDLAAAYELNVAGYIVKPVDFHEFVEMIGIITRYWSICQISS